MAAIISTIKKIFKKAEGDKAEDSPTSTGGSSSDSKPKVGSKSNPEAEHSQNSIPVPTPVFNFSFKVVVSGVGTDESSNPEFFNSVDGLGKYTSKVSSKDSPGGEMGDVSFPSNFGTKNLILRRPLMNKTSDISKWVATALKTFSYTPTQIYIFIMNVENEIVAQWTVHNAYPVSVNISPVSMYSGTTIIEEVIEIKYNDITMDKP